MNRTRALPLRRAAIGVALVLAGTIAATSPARASSITDGTSNTLQFADAAAASQARSGVCAFPDVCWKSGDARLIIYNGHAGLGGN